MVHDVANIRFLFFLNQWVMLSLNICLRVASSVFYMVLCLYTVVPCLIVYVVHMFVGTWLIQQNLVCCEGVFCWFTGASVCN